MSVPRLALLATAFLASVSFAQIEVDDRPKVDAERQSDAARG